MGAAATITQEEASHFPQYQLLGGSSKFNELKSEDGTISLEKIEDPYLVHGGVYANDSKDTAGFKYVQYNELPKFKDAHRSFLAQVLSAELFDSLKDVVTSSGFTLSNAIQAGVVCPGTDIGVSAGDEDSYEKFKALYVPIIKAVHGYDADAQSHVTDYDVKGVELTSNESELFAAYAISSKVTATRNVSGYSFASGMSLFDRVQVEELFKEFTSNSSIPGEYISFGDISEEAKAAIASKGVSTAAPSAVEFITASGGARSWPTSRGVFQSSDDSIQVLVNKGEFLTISVSNPSNSDVTSAFKLFVDYHKKVEDFLISKEKRFAFSSTYGYLSSNLANIGTGMKLSTICKLSGLFSSQDILREVFESVDVDWRSLEEGLYEITSRKVLGVTESQTVISFVKDVSKIFTCEKLIGCGASVESIRGFISTGNVPDITPSSDSPVDVAPVKSPRVQSVVSPRDRNASPVTVVATSPKAAAAQPGSPKKTPRTARETFIPSKSPRAQESIVGTLEGTVAVETKPVIGENAEVHGKFLSDQPFMSTKLNSKLKIQIDEIHYPEH